MSTDDAADSIEPRYPVVDVTPAQYEDFVARLFRSLSAEVDEVRVELHEVIAAADGTYDFDATVRFQVAGMDFLTIVEAKKHKRRVERALVANLLQKVASVGAHKGVMVSTAGYQSGAVQFAKLHGIALAVLTEDEFTYINRYSTPASLLRAPKPRRRRVPPTLAAFHYELGDEPGSMTETLLLPERPDLVAGMLLQRSLP